MNNKYAMSADKAGFYDSGQDVYEKSDNGAWISSELRQTVQPRIPSSPGHAFCIQSSSGISYITVCKILHIFLSSKLISQHCNLKMFINGILECMILNRIPTQEQIPFACLNDEQAFQYYWIAVSCFANLLMILEVMENV